MSNGKGLKRVPLFWLTYRNPDGRAAGVVIESPDLLQPRFKPAVYEMDRGLEIASGHQLDHRRVQVRSR